MPDNTAALSISSCSIQRIYFFPHLRQARSVISRRFFADVPELRLLPIQFSPLSGHDFTILWSQLTDLTLDFSGSHGAHQLTLTSPFPVPVHVKHLTFICMSLHSLFSSGTFNSFSSSRSTSPATKAHNHQVFFTDPIYPLRLLLRSSAYPMHPSCKLDIKDVVLLVEPLIQLVTLTPALTELRFTCWQSGSGDHRTSTVIPSSSPYMWNKWEVDAAAARLFLLVASDSSVLDITAIVHIE
ncbi:hypothetical protein DFS33DRAFT_128071 [Desarmillaria ectypa]|nr:hypothetical protein DFS33DRAFT_128071 [Desarmillaria ectypa]